MAYSRVILTALQPARIKAVVLAAVLWLTIEEHEIRHHSHWSDWGNGKTTIGALLAHRLSLPQYSMDERRWDYYKAISYDEELAKHKRETEGFWGVYQYWKPFEAYAVERLLSEHNQCIIDFGAGHSVYEDAALFQRVQQALAPYPNVVLLLPSPNKYESVQILNERNKYVPDDKPNINEHFIRHASNYELAKFTVYTKGKTPEETCSEILNLIKGNFLYAWSHSTSC